ncbi:hypothetical protein [Parasphingorhabdus sp.]|uniref:hypothetical protein n=1 Tax=Parasphingorhabdus sp. TaxID=2709688 RepID=UPI0030025D4F
MGDNDEKYTGKRTGSNRKKKNYEKPVLIILNLDGDSTMGKNPAMNEFTNGFGVYGASLSEKRRQSADEPAPLD